MTRAGDILDEHTEVREEWLEDMLTVRNFDEVVDDMTGTTSREVTSETEWSGRIDRSAAPSTERSGRGVETSSEATAIIDHEAPVYSPQDEHPYASHILASGREWRVMGVYDLGTGRLECPVEVIDE